MSLFISIMTFGRNNFYCNSLFVYSVDDTEVLIYAPAPIAGKITFQLFYLPRSCGWVFFHFFK